MTRFGPLDLLGTIGQGLDFAELLPQSIEVDIGPGISVRCSTSKRLSVQRNTWLPKRIWPSYLCCAEP